MNLKDIRQAIFDSEDWSPLQSSDAVGTVNRFINRAYNVIAEDAPYLFFESQVKLATKADFSPGTDDTLTTAHGGTDYWVLARSAGGTTAGGWPTDGDWDGRMIAITDPTSAVAEHHGCEDDLQGLLGCVLPARRRHHGQLDAPLRGWQDLATRHGRTT